MVDLVNRPPHYLQGGIETIDVIESRLTKEEFVGYLKGCKMKYDLRYPFKGAFAQDFCQTGFPSASRPNPFGRSLI